MRTSYLLAVLLIGTCFIYAGCNNSEQNSGTENKASTTEEVKEDISRGAGEVDEAVEDVVDKTEEMHEEQLREWGEKAPPEIAAELWKLIQTENYRMHWKEFAGPEVSKNGAKSGSYYKTYLNDKAYKALEDKVKPLPPGSIIVKDKYDDQNQLTSIIARINFGGDEPDDIRWFTAQYSPDGEVLYTNKMGKGVKSAP
ncbi:MAG: hypothetical protein RIG61_03210 [Deltaproteobacteria bacterium]